MHKAAAPNVVLILLPSQSATVSIHHLVEKSTQTIATHRRGLGFVATIRAFKKKPEEPVDNPAFVPLSLATALSVCE
jgi:hypothetical protein